MRVYSDVARSRGIKFWVGARVLRVEGRFLPELFGASF